MHRGSVPKAGRARRTGHEEPVRSPRTAERVFGLWIAIHLVVVGAALAGGPWPWHMFARAVHVETELVAEGRVAHGTWIDLALEDHFHYTRGFTAFRIYDEARATTRPGHPRAKRDFARWIGERALERGLEVEAVRLRRHTQPIGGGPTRSRTLVEVELGG
jgi:hypothetical protein